MYRSFVALKVLDGTKTSLAQLQNQNRIKTNFCPARLSSKSPFF
jgi:hypothetical protein